LQVVVKEPNPNFIQQFQRKFPSKETFFIVGCSDGKSYTLDALEALDEAGYVNMVALKGGYYSWFRKWDNNLRRWAETAGRLVLQGSMLLPALPALW
jgi:hypothetical protein